MDENKEISEKIYTSLDETAEIVDDLTQIPKENALSLPKNAVMENQISKNSSKKKRKEKHHILIQIIFSITLAIGLWAYVINVVNPPQSVTFREIPVQLLGLDAINSTRLTIAGDGIYTVDVTVSASRSEINSISASDVNANINLTGLSAGQNYVSVKVSVPNNVTIEDIRSQKIQVYIEELVTEEKPVVIEHASIEGDYEVTITAKETNSVLVTGAKSLVDMIQKIQVNLDLNSLSVDKSTTSKLTGIPIDADGNEVKNVKLSHPQMYISASIYQVKEIPLDINYYGNPGLGAQLSRVELPNALRVKAVGSVLKTLQNIPTEAINIDGILDDTTLNVKYKLPENVYLAETAQEPNITFVLIHTGQISFTYQSSEIKILTPAPEDCENYSFSTNSVTVTAKGDLSTIRKLEAKDLQPSVDLSSLVNGDNNIALSCAYSNKKINIKISPTNLKVFANIPPEVEEVTTPTEIQEGETPQEPTAENTQEKAEEPTAENIQEQTNTTEEKQ